MKQITSACMYDDQYYIRHQLGSYQSAKAILSYLLTKLDIDSVMDFGCGMGTWCQVAHELGISDIIGIDIHPYNKDYMLLPMEIYHEINLQYFTSFHRKADLVISVEVGEHIDSSCSRTFIRNLCDHGDLVLFSAAIPFQQGTGHINEQKCSYWLEIFNSYGYLPLDCIRPRFWDAPDVEIWYKNNCILYVKKEEFDKISKKIKVDPFPIDIIHPDMLKRIINKNKQNG